MSSTLALRALVIRCDHQLEPSLGHLMMHNPGAATDQNPNCSHHTGCQNPCRVVAATAVTCRAKKREVQHKCRPWQPEMQTRQNAATHPIMGGSCTWLDSRCSQLSAKTPTPTALLGQHGLAVRIKHPPIKLPHLHCKHNKTYCSLACPTSRQSCQQCGMTERPCRHWQHHKPLLLHQ